MSTAAGSLAQDMLLALHDQKLSDITVIAFGQTFHLHRLILRRSGYFHSLILGQGDWIEKSRQSITIKFDSTHVTLQSFQRTIHWLYGIDFHYTEGSAPLMFQPTPATGGRGGLKQTLEQGSASTYHTPSGSTTSNIERHGLGLSHGIVDHATTERSSVSASGNVSARRFDNILLDPSNKVDELLISMYATASYLSIATLTEEICSDIAHRIRDSRGLIQYMEYAWKLNNGRAWDIILAHCFYQFSWYTYKSFVLQEMLVSQDMPIAGLVKVLVSESLWVPSEYERYQLVKGIMLRRLDLDVEKLREWASNFHEHDWLGEVLKDQDDDDQTNLISSSDTFLNNIQDWESNSTTEYEDAVDSDHEWITTSKDLRRRSSQVSTGISSGIKLTTFDEDRTVTPTVEAATSRLKTGTSSGGVTSPETNAEGGATPIQQHTALLDSTSEDRTVPRSPTLGTPISSPSLSALSIASDTLPKHQVRDLLVLMYILHHSINFTHMTFDQLNQVLSEELVLPTRVKDAFWRQHILRRMSVNSNPSNTRLTSTSSSNRRDIGTTTTHRSGVSSSTPSRTKLSKSDSTSTTSTVTTNSQGLLPIRFSTSLYISRRDLMTDGKHFTSSTFYGGSWWSIQVGNNLNADNQVGVFLSSSPTPRASADSNEDGGRGSRGSRGGGSIGLLAALRRDHQTSSTPGAYQRRNTPGGSSGASGQGGIPDKEATVDSSSFYSRKRELTCNYRIYMTTNVAESPHYFAAAAANRLDEIRRNEHTGFSLSHNPNNTSANEEFLARFGLNGGETRSSVMSTSPEMTSSSFSRLSSQAIASEDEMIGEDKFKVNEGWGYRHLRYLTRVARQVRDQPPRSTVPSLSSQENSHSTMPLSPNLGPMHQQHQQAQTQLAQQQAAQQGQFPHPPNNNPGGQIGQQPLQPQPQNQHQQHLQQQMLQHGHGGNVNANINANGPGQGVQTQATGNAQQPIQPQNQQQQQQQQQQAQQQQQQQQHQQQQQQQQPPPNPSTPTPMTTSSTSYGTSNEEAEDDGLWIHFVVKVGWTDNTKAESKVNT